MMIIAISNIPIPTVAPTAIARVLLDPDEPDDELPDVPDDGVEDETLCGGGGDDFPGGD